jgi:hypothetical protein
VPFVERLLDEAVEGAGLPDGFTYDEGRGLIVDELGRPLVAELHLRSRLVATSISTDVDTFAQRDLGAERPYPSSVVTLPDTDIDTRAVADKAPNERRVVPLRTAD